MDARRGIPIIPFLFPINVYLIGDAIGAGIQFLLLRFVGSFSGRSIIPVWREVQLVTSGIITGRTALSIALWAGGVIILAGTAALLISNRGEPRKNVVGYGIGCAFLVVSTMVQYGPLFHGPAGVAIPIGIPALAVIGYLLWKDVRSGADPDEDDDEPALDDPSDVKPITGAFPVEPDADNAVSVSE